MVDFFACKLISMRDKYHVEQPNRLGNKFEELCNIVIVLDMTCTHLKGVPFVVTFHS